MENDLTATGPVLFNDVYTNSWEALSPAPVPDGAVFVRFPRLPVELRLHIWLLYLRRHRMIEVDISSAIDDDEPDIPESRYTDRNHLGRVISGGRYILANRGRESIPTPLIFQVNREARGAALSFYQIHLPFPGWQHKKQVLYLNPKYDVVFVRPRDRPIPPDWIWRYQRPEGPEPEFAKLLVDFLHDARAYDCKGQGYTHPSFFRSTVLWYPFPEPRLTSDNQGRASRIQLRLSPPLVRPLYRAAWTAVHSSKPSPSWGGFVHRYPPESAPISAQRHRLPAQRQRSRRVPNARLALPLRPNIPPPPARPSDRLVLLAYSRPAARR